MLTKTLLARSHIRANSVSTDSLARVSTRIAIGVASRAKAKIAVRIQRMTNSNFGDVAPVGGGVSELRIHYGPGYRVYFARRGRKLIILLCGGNKSSQRRDISLARKMEEKL